jgi:hypothetical protein
MSAASGQEQYARLSGPVGQVRPTGLTMLLFFVTLGIRGFVHHYQAPEEMLRHSGTGLGGVAAGACRAGIPGRTRLSRDP